MDASHPDYAKLTRTRNKYYGNYPDGTAVSGDFGGYVVYQIDAVTGVTVARYPAIDKPNSDRMPSNTAKLLSLAGGNQEHEYYDHPSYTVYVCSQVGMRFASQQ